MDSFVRTENGITYTAEDMEKWMDKGVLKEANLRVYGKETRPGYAKIYEAQF